MLFRLSTYASVFLFKSILDATDRPAAVDTALNMANQVSLGKEQRQHALRCILKFAKLNDGETWKLAFSKTLNILTQILDNEQDDVLYKVYSLRIIRELLTHHTSLFMNYIELTIFRILKAQSEVESEVSASVDIVSIARLPSRSHVRRNKRHMLPQSICLRRAPSAYSNRSSNRRNIL